MRIIVPLDGSLLAEWAIAPVALLARRAATPVTITLLAVNTHDRAQEEIAEEFSPAVIVGIPDRTPKYLHYLTQIREVPALADLAITIEVIPGEPAEAISAFARAQGADLIVLASHVLTKLDAA
jgi:nucleotide-binding universal stress UspA family protein